MLLRVSRRELYALLATYLVLAGVVIATAIGPLLARMGNAAAWTLTLLAALALMAPAQRIWRASRGMALAPVSRLVWSTGAVTVSVFLAARLLLFFTAP